VASFTYTGEEELVFPTLGVTVNKGDTIDAPDDFNNPLFTAAKTKSAPAPTSTEEVTK
jgi:hypothetical protein